MADSKQTDMKKLAQDSPSIVDEECRRRSVTRFEHATLHNVDLKAVVSAANGVPHERWISMKFKDVFDDLHAVVSMMQQCDDGKPPLCTKKTCCEAKIFKHIWAVGPNREKQEVSPPEYISLLMDWVRNAVNRDDVKLSLSDMKRIVKRLARIYVHFYSVHGKQFAEYKIDAHMNYCFKHFLYFAEGYEFIKPEELEPILPIVNMLMRRSPSAQDAGGERSFDPPGRTPRDPKERGDKEAKPAAKAPREASRQNTPKPPVVVSSGPLVRNPRDEPYVLRNPRDSEPNGVHLPRKHAEGKAPAVVRQDSRKKLKDAGRAGTPQRQTKLEIPDARGAAPLKVPEKPEWLRGAPLAPHDGSDTDNRGRAPLKVPEKPEWLRGAPLPPRSADPGAPRTPPCTQPSRPERAGNGSDRKEVTPEKLAQALERGLAPKNC